MPHASEKKVSQPITILELSNTYDVNLTLIKLMFKEKNGPIVRTIDKM